MTTLGSLSQQSVVTIRRDVAAIGLISMLREAGLAIDSLWQEAVIHGNGEDAMNLGDASQGIHRALIALDGYPPAW